MGTPPPPPGWYDDPGQPGAKRYWDGQQWTENTQPGVAAQAAPPGFAPAGAAPAKSGSRMLPLLGVLVAAVTAVLVFVLLSGGDDNKKSSGSSGSSGGSAKAAGDFNDPQFGITFNIPKGLEERSDVTISQSGGSQAVALKAFALDKVNLVLLQRYDLGRKVGKDDLPALKTQIEPLVEQIAGTDLTPIDVEHGGLPGFRFEDVKVTTPPSTSRLIFLFDGDREYQFACQFDDKNGAKILEACDAILASVQRK
jgi:hypothetical protein